MSNLQEKSFMSARAVGQSDHVPCLIERRPSRLVALDFETAAPYDHIVEIGAVEIMDGVLTGRAFHRLVRPCVPIDSFTAAVHGITDRNVAGKPYFADVADPFLDFLGDAPLVAHAAYVERTILEKELCRLGHEALSRARFICTLAMARQSRRFPRNGLRDVCEALEIRVAEVRSGFHDALGDAEMAAWIYLRLAALEQLDAPMSVVPARVDTRAVAQRSDFVHDDPPVVGRVAAPQRARRISQGTRMTKSQLIEAVLKEMDRVWGEDKGLGGTDEEYAWLLANYEISEEEDVKWQLVLEGSMGDLPEEDADDPEVQEFLDDEAAVHVFLEGFLEKYHGSTAVYQRSGMT